MSDHLKNNAPVTPWMASLFGGLLWIPGVGLPVSDAVYLQPIEIFIMGWLLFTVIPSLATFLRIFSGRDHLFIYIGLVSSWVISSIWSIDQSTSFIYLAYYLLFILPGILLFFFIATNGLLFVQFISGFIFGAIVSSFAGFFQIALGTHMVRLVNNKQYSLIYGLHKASGFAPEASILAGLLIIAIMIILMLLTEEDVRTYCDQYHIAAYLTEKRWIGLTLLILLSALFCTLSSSVIIILPIVILSGYMMMNKYQKLSTTLISLFLIILIVGSFIIIAWSTRSLEDSIGSIVLRLAAIVAAMKIAAANWLHGVGLGMLKMTIGEQVEQNIRAWDVGPHLKHWIENNQKDGVDSFPLHLMAEQGIIIFVLFIVALTWLVSVRNQSRENTDEPGLLTIVSVVGISVFIIGAFTVGYRGLFHLWLLFPCAGAIRSMQYSRT